MEYNSYEVYEIFYFGKDLGLETEIEKVLVNEQNIFDFYDGATHFRKILSFYGDAEEMTNYFQSQFDEKLNLKNDKYPATLYGIFTDKVIYLVLSCNPCFFHDKPLKKESLLIVMKKFLQDITSNIVIFPDRFILDKWTNEQLSPFDEDYSVIRKIEIIDKTEEKLEIEDFDLEYKNVEDIFLNESETVNFNNNFSPNIWLYKVYNNRDNQEKSSSIFFNKIKNELLRCLKMKHSEVLDEGNKLGLSFTNEDLTVITNIIDNVNSYLLSSMHSFRVHFFNQFCNDLKNVCTQSRFLVFGSKNVYLNPDNHGVKEKLEDMLLVCLKSKFQKFFYFTSDFNYLRFDWGEFNLFLGNYYRKVSDLAQPYEQDEFYKKLSKIRNSKFYQDLLENEKNSFEKKLSSELDLLNKFHIDFINSNSFRDCMEVNKISINVSRNDLTGKSSLNLLQLPNKLKFDEKLLLDKIYKKNHEIPFFKKFKILGIFPTSTPLNYIIIFSKSEYDGESHYITFCFSQNIKLLMIINYRKGDNYFYKYIPQIETLAIFETSFDKIRVFKITKDGTKEDERVLIVKFNHVLDIDDVIYFENCSKFLFLSNGALYELNINQNKPSVPMKCKGNIQREQVEDYPIQPNRGHGKYKNFIYSGYGDFFGLQSDKYIDFYDINFMFQKDKSINVENSLAKIFSDNNNSYLLIFNKITKTLKSKIFIGCGGNFQILEEERKKAVILGNPILDYIYSGFVKYGPKTNYISNEKKINYIFYVFDDKRYDETEKQVIDYAEALFKNIPEINFKTTRNLNLEVEELASHMNYSDQEMGIMRKILLSRVPLQICSIENDNIIPLNDGRRIVISDNFTKMKKIAEKAKYLSFGYLEKLLRDIKEDIFLVCIIGRQSSGKSYLLNRIYETRFAVAATRCTDGIWASYSYCDKQHLIILDCEGLFSRQRKEIEEIKLLTLLAAISDFTYLNQDLTFNRHLNDLLNNLDKSVDRLNGNKLFKGKLIWTVRDVANTEKDGAYREFMGHINSFQKNGMKFIQKLFNGKIDFVSLNNYENLAFNKEIEKLRSSALLEKKNNKENNLVHWMNGDELINNLKIILVQLYTDDDSNADEIVDQFFITELTEKLEELWLDLSKEEKAFEFCFTYKKENSETLDLTFDLRNLNLVYLNETLNLENLEKEFMDKIVFVREEQNKKILHNEIYENFDNFINEFKEFRLKIILSKVEKALKEKFSAEKEQKYFNDFKNNFSLKIADIGICKKQCSKCFLICKKLKNHKEKLEDVYSKKRAEVEKIKYSEKDLKDIELIEEKKKLNENLKKRVNLIKDEFRYFDDWYQKKTKIDLNRAEIYERKSELDKKSLELDSFFGSGFDKNISCKDLFAKQFKELNEILSYLKTKEFRKVCLINDIEIVEESNLPHVIVKIQNLVNNLFSVIRENNNKIDYLDSDLRKLFNSRSEIDTMRKSFFSKEREENFILAELDKKKKEYEQTSSNNEDKISKLSDDINSKQSELDEKEKLLLEKNQDLNFLSHQFSFIENYKTKGQDKLDWFVQMFINFQKLNVSEKSVKDCFLHCNQEIINTNKKIDELKNSFIYERTKELKNTFEKYEKRLLTATGITKKKILQEKDLIEKQINNISEKTNSEINENLEYHNLTKYLEKLSHQEKLYNQKQKILNDKISQLEKEIELLNGILDLETSENLEEVISKITEMNEVKERFLDNEIEEVTEFKISELMSIPNEVQDLVERLKIKIEKIFSSFSSIEFNQIKFEVEELEKNILGIKITLQNLKENQTKLVDENKNIDSLYEMLEKEISEHEEIKKKIEDSIFNLNENDLKSLELNIQDTLNSKNLLTGENKECLELNNLSNELLNKIESLSKDINQFQISKTEIEKKSMELNTLKENLMKFEAENVMILKEFAISGKKIEDYSEIMYQQKSKDLTDLEITVKESTLELDNLCKKSQDLIKRNALNEEIEMIKEEMKNSCDCGTDHQCEIQCKICPLKKCVNKANHDGSHFCEMINHKCNLKCETAKCNQDCELDADHIGEHKCYSGHKCLEVCRACSNLCANTFVASHDYHICNSTVCPHKCILCKKNCSSKDHFHDMNTEEIWFNGEYTKLHLCGDEHECYQSCNDEGTCTINYNEIIKTFESSFGEEFSYTYVQPLISFEKCKIMLPIGEYSHEGKHKCEKALKNEHRCNIQCPDCKSVCREQLNHHSLHQFNHRNKEYCYFTNETGENIIINDERGSRKYAVGEKAIAEDCYSSCKRRGRGHIHLIKCKDKLRCLEKLPFIRHSNKKYKGFESNEYDELSCEDFWKLYDIQNPLGLEIGEISKCNFICSNCETEKNKVFCSEKVLHSLSTDRKEHAFSCTCNERKVYNGIDICFCIDITGSMSSYIKQSKETIKNIIQKVKNKIEKELKSPLSTLRISIVGYRDHGDTNITEDLAFSNHIDAERFLDNLIASGGGDAPEAVADGLSKAINMNWSTDSNEKILFLVLDAPPHGKRYFTGSDKYPDGCPCKLDIDHLLNEFSKKKVQIHVLKIGNLLNKMEIEFKKTNKEINFTHLEGFDSESLMRFNQIITDIICRKINEKEMTVLEDI